MVFSFCFSNSIYNETDIIIGLIEYEQNSLLGASHLIDYISYQVLGQKPPRQKPPDINPRTKTPWTKTPLAKISPDKKPPDKTFFSEIL